MNKYKTFEEAFLSINRYIIDNPKYIVNSRMGKMYECSPISYIIEDLTSYEFSNSNIGRLDYTYCGAYYNWMVQGNTEVKELVEKYPNTSRYLEKPKSDLLPENFNTFYGPRILSQLPLIIDELKNKENSRRGVIMILSENDAKLLPLNETLEYPCTDSATFSIREGKLNVHVHMRSQNMAQVLKLDMYLWGRFTCELAEQLNVIPGQYSTSIVSAHVYERDIEYINSL